MKYIYTTKINKHDMKAKAKITRISQFSANTLAIFTEYTAWAAFGGVSWKWPKVTFYKSISIIAYLIFLLFSQLKQICKWGIKYAHLLTTDHMYNTCAHYYPHTTFYQCSSYRSLDI